MFEGFFLFSGDVGVSCAGATDAVVSFSNRGKGAFNLREEFLDFDVLTGGGPSKMVERPLDNLFTVC